MYTTKTNFDIQLKSQRSEIIFAFPSSNNNLELLFRESDWLFDLLEIRLNTFDFSSNFLIISFLKYFAYIPSGLLGWKEREKTTFKLSVNHSLL